MCADRTGGGVPHLMPTDSARSGVFKVFPEALRQKYGQVALVTENASSHKSKLSKRCPESAGGDVPMYLPPYTPQLNPPKCSGGR